jgi:cyanophycinase
VTSKSRGTLIIIGGREEKATDGNRCILEEVCRRVKRRKAPLLIMPVASGYPDEVAAEYEQVFKDLGVSDIRILDIRSREAAYEPAALEKLEGDPVVFFTGGDQLRITSQVGDSPVYQTITRIYHDGGVIAGTSAGAAAMPETMIVAGPRDESNQISALGMAPGLGLINGVVIDSHFAQRGRFGRLLGVVAQNPRNLGIGIDENTAIVAKAGQHFRVIGGGAVYVVDGTDIGYSSLSETHPEGVVSIYDVKLHVLGNGDAYDLTRRRPIIPENVGEPEETHANGA